MTKELNDYVLPDYVLPALYEGPMPPPSYPVPPEDVSLWKAEDLRIYETWKKWVSKDTKKTKKKFRKFLSQVNTEHQEVFDLIADGVWGLRRLLTFMQKFPGYNLEQDLECYNNEENLAVIKIVDIGLEVVADEQKRCGLEVVCEKLPTLQPPESDPQQLLQQPAKDCPSEPEGHSCIVAGEADVAAFQEGKVELKVENKTEITNNKTPFVRKDNEKTKNRSKRKRHERLLRFQEKLVKTSGLPPSRLMKQRFDHIGQITLKKSLAGEFEHLAESATNHAQVSLHEMEGHGHVPPPTPVQGKQGLTPHVLMPGQQVLPPPPPPPELMPVQPANTFPCSALMPGQSCPTVQMQGQQYPPPSLMPGQTASPHLEFLQSHPMSQTVTTSGFNYLPTLCSSPVTFAGSGDSVIFPPSPLGLKPAYCFHCLQFGSVFTINQI